MGSFRDRAVKGAIIMFRDLLTTNKIHRTIIYDQTTSTMKDLSHDRPLRYEAVPFYPHNIACPPNPSLEFAIYNDGQPCLMATCEAEVSEILHGIQDEALDENFPPDAQEAAELEEVDTFNEIQALLALLEERDEQARSGFRHIKKRWEARRREGLRMGHKQKADPSKTVAMESRRTIHAPRSQSSSQAMIPYAHHCHKLMQEKSMQRSMMMKDPAMHMMMNRNKATMNHHMNRFIPIQQPRKQN